MSAATPASEGLGRDLNRWREQAEHLAERLPGLLVEADRVAATVAQGVHGRRRTGVGESFWQFRLYQAGDDATDIDWRQSARSRHMFVREQEWEAAESVWIWCDLSPSMRFRSGRRVPHKVERAAVLSLALGAMLIRGGERIALLGSGERSRGGRHGLNAFARSLGASERAAAPLPPPVELPRFARVALISDLLEPVEDLMGRLAGYVARGARGCLLQVVDPAEETLPYAGRVLFEGLEAEGRALIGNVGNVRERYVRRFTAHREELARQASRQGWRFAVHHTDRTAESGLLTLYQMLAPKAVR